MFCIVDAVQTGRVVPEKVPVDHRSSMLDEKDTRRREKQRRKDAQVRSLCLSCSPCLRRCKFVCLRRCEFMCLRRCVCVQSGTATPVDFTGQQTDEAAEADREARRERRQRRRDDRAKRQGGAAPDDADMAASVADSRGGGGGGDGGEEDFSEGDGPLPDIPGAPKGRDRALKHGGHLAPMDRVGTDGVQVNPRKRGRAARIERDLVRMKNENQRCVRAVAGDRLALVSCRVSRVLAAGVLSFSTPSCRPCRCRRRCRVASLYCRAFVSNPRCDAASSACICRCAVCVSACRCRLADELARVREELRHKEMEVAQLEADALTRKAIGASDGPKLEEQARRYRVSLNEEMKLVRLVVIPAKRCSDRLWRAHVLAVAFQVFRESCGYVLRCECVCARGRRRRSRRSLSVRRRASLEKRRATQRCLPCSGKRSSRSETRTSTRHVRTARRTCARGWTATTSWVPA